MAKFFLKAEWDFTPDKWACIGYRTTGQRDGFFKRTGAGSIIAFWITEGHSEDKNMWGKFVGLFELSEERDETEKFVCPKFWDENLLKWGTDKKWIHGVGIKRAWMVNRDDWQPIGMILPDTYKHNSRRPIAQWGKEIKETNFDKIKKLRIKPKEVYDQPFLDTNTEIETVGDLLKAREIQLYGLDGFPVMPEPIKLEALKPSRAGPTNRGNYPVREIDGPKYLYILQLEGSVADWLGKHYSPDYENKIIVKVGYSNNPKRRCHKDIQSSYPFGQFTWHIMFPTELGNPHAPDEDTAKIGEQAMKNFFRAHPEAKSLGGEFFLVPKRLCKKCFEAGLDALP